MTVSVSALMPTTLLLFLGVHLIHLGKKTQGARVCPTHAVVVTYLDTGWKCQEGRPFPRGNHVSRGSWWIKGRSQLVESRTNLEMLYLTALLVPDSPPCLNSNNTGCFESSSKEILIKACLDVIPLQALCWIKHKAEKICWQYISMRFCWPPLNTGK